MTRDASRGISEVGRPSRAPESPRPGFVIGPPPCDDCLHAKLCRTRQLACKAFSTYVKSGQWKRQDVGKLPNRGPYRRLFQQ
jgi:hypothetical protein